MASVMCRDCGASVSPLAHTCEICGATLPRSAGNSAEPATAAAADERAMIVNEDGDPFAVSIGLSAARQPVVELPGVGLIRLNQATNLLLGRSPDSPLSPVASDNVSSRHAELRWDGSNVWITDLGSLNGTYVNGERLASHRSVALEHDCVVRLASSPPTIVTIQGIGQ